MSVVFGFVVAVSLLVMGIVMRKNSRALAVLRGERSNRRYQRLCREVRR